ncbi:MAG TPA: DUF6164 family protein [Gammaproteobacteria bacterium]
MPKLLMNLRNVPDDEADEIRALLEARQIPYYETEPSFWGVSGGGIWIRRREDFAEAERVLIEYHHERWSKARAEHRAALREGKVGTVWAAVRESPLRAAVVLLGIAFAVLLLVLPLLMLAG